MTGMTIGRLSERTGCKVQTVRYYEQIGLLPAPARSAGNQRLYGREHLQRVGFIRHCRELGFPLDTVRDLLALCDQPERSCAQVDKIARAHLQLVQAKISRLTSMQAELERMITECEGGRIADCRIVEALGERAHEAERAN
jgi:DNA-binding transcriptional MerR regulator